MEDGPQNINCDTTKTKYVQKENRLSMCDFFILVMNN
ncbi:hypothetical protein CDLVIII_5397 [Clostridium sp. DL-VIII]|nr:hypothetical protein CDLVIII_5397 [Clostridium sp. DL-VIII]